jgi:heme/copper-type cytochrome/quinol oxidase subunit 4
MNETKSSLAESFSITCGGPLHWLLVRLGYAGDERQLVVRRALLAVLITWLPLLVFSMVCGQAYGHEIKIPFLRDFAVNVRFLIALPILILAESGIDQRWRILTLEFLRSKLVADSEVPLFETLIEKTNRLRDRVLPEVLLLIAAFLPSIFVIKTELLMSGTSNWHTTSIGSGELSLAGWWFNFVSAPFFRFLLLRWIWRLFLATSLLWRVSRMNLYLVATHADRAAGLGFLPQGQKAFSPIVFAGGTVIAAQVANAIAYQGATLSSMKSPMITYGVLAIILLVAPLLVVTPVLLRVRKKALLEYTTLVTIHNQQFDQKWIQKKQPTDVVILGNPDPSSLIDLGSSFHVIRQMGIMPIDKPTLITLAVAAALPMAPIVLYATPADMLIRTVLKMLGYG